jgi:uncharacterized protein (TIGR02391 family)
VPRVPLFEQSVLQSLCDILGDTSNGLTGNEIGLLLQACGINDPSPGMTKRYRLFDALQMRQQRDKCGNFVVAFVCEAMKPVRYVGSEETFEDRRSHLNQALAFAGYLLREDGKIIATTKTETLTQAQKRAHKLWRELQGRRVHGDVMRFCRAELLEDNYFHAVFEATKSVADKIREQSRLDEDGSRLVDKAFGGERPRLAFNTLQTQTERTEQAGLMNLIKGLFGTFRNITAHEPRIKWTIEEEDAFDLLSLASLVHRRLDRCVWTGYADDVG